MLRKEIEKIYNNKIKKIKKYDKAYFQDDNPVISDKEYDYIKQEDLKKLHTIYQCYLWPMLFLKKILKTF